jgi:rubrerythrin
MTVMAGLLKRFFGTRGTTRASQVTTVRATLYSGHETLEVVGESHYQDALWQIVGGRTRDPVRYETHAILVPDPDNRYDDNAIEVRIDGLLVGYLSRDDAAEYRPGLLRLIATSANGLVALHAVVVGGGPRPDGIGYLGVFLDHDPADFGLAPHHTSNGHLRTGLSEAIATDLEDDSYDLSWYRELSEDDHAAARQLRSLLDSESELISRHYMFCELEHRLYRCRGSLPSALDEFDSTCTQHHAEMDTIRPALLEKFGAVPVIEMYRQAVIRAQKAKLWESAREWAERGIDVYGDSAARPEVVEDLRKRIAYTTAKIEAAQRPKPQRLRRTTVETVHRAAQVETLVCAACGTTFERLRTRGRKPKTCPACRGISSPAVTA